MDTISDNTTGGKSQLDLLQTLNRGGYTMRQAAMEIARLRAALEDVLERHPEEVKILAEHGYDDVKE